MANRGRGGPAGRGGSDGGMRGGRGGGRQPPQAFRYVYISMTNVNFY